jgi:tetratricopeptide (TPR) repeat protein
MRLYLIVFGIVSIIFGTTGITFYSDWIAPNEEGKQLLKEGKLFLEQNTKYSSQEAVKRFTALAAKFNNHPLGQEGVFHLGVAYTKMGFRKEAYLKFRSLYFNKNLYSDDLKERVQFQLGKLQIIQNLADEGLTRLYALLRNTSNHKLRAKIYFEIGNHYYRNDQLRKAKDSYEIALMEDPLLEDARIKLSETYQKLGKYWASYELYESYLKGQANLSKKKPKITEKYLASALAIGKKLYKQGETDPAKYYEAIKHFRIVYQYYSNTVKSDEALFYTGLCFKAIKDFQVAIKYFKMVTSNSVPFLDPDAIFQIGIIYFFNKKNAMAASAFRDFLEKYPSHALAPKAKDYYDEATELLQLESGYLDDESVTEKDVVTIEGEDEEVGEPEFFDEFPEDDEDLPPDYKVKGKKAITQDKDLESDELGDQEDIIPEDEKIKGF